MEYTILHADILWNLEKEVNEHIKKGWRPQGGVMIHQNPHLKMTLGSINAGTHYCQAMIKEIE